MKIRSNVRAGMQTGTVKWYVPQKGFGFITPTSGGKDIFVHQSDILPGNTLIDNAAVEFDVVQGRKGLQATRVHLV